MTGQVLEPLRWAVLLVFCGTALVGLRRWWRLRSAAAAWVAGTFGALALGLVLARVDRLLVGDGPSLLVLGLPAVLAVVAFPWLLARFADSIQPLAPWARRLIDAAGAAALALAALATSALAPAGDSEPAWFGTYVLVLVGYWTALSLLVIVRLWRGGSGQSTPTRRRMRTLASGAVLLNVALLLGAADDEQAGLAVASQALAIGSAGVFAVGFAPPRGLRATWRLREEGAFREVEEGLMTATSREAVAQVVLPAVARVLGSGAAALLDGEGNPVAVHGGNDPPARSEVTRARERAGRAQDVYTEDDRLVVPLRRGMLSVTISPFMPFFGEEEAGMLKALGVSVDLALARLESYEQEHRAKVRVEEINDELQALVYGISHDLRNPLVSVLGYSDLLSSDFGDRLGDEGRHFIDRIRASAAYMDALIQDLLELSRVGRMQDEVVDVPLGPLLAEIVGQVERSRPHATFRRGDLPVLRMSPVRARQLFTNLLENAIVHGRREDITVAVAAAEQADGGGLLTVSDDGVGVPPEYRERLFGIFERLPSEEGQQPGGTGIGLAICRKIVEGVGGTIRFVDAPVGATVEVRLPPSAVAGSSALEVAG